MYELPKPFQSPSVDTPHREYPSAVFHTTQFAFVGDGYGTLYLLHIPDAGRGEIVGTQELSSSGDVPLSTPFRVHIAVESSPGIATVILSSRHYSEEPKPSTSRKPTSIEFDVYAVAVPLSPVDEPKSLHVLWHRRGENVLVSCTYDSSRKAFLFLGASIYRNIGDAPRLGYEPSADEIAPIPRKDENLDTQPTAPPPYSWTQSSDSVTVAFPLPATTLKSNIKVHLTSSALTLHVDGDIPPGIPRPHYSLKKFWDGISTPTSFWTWDREAEHAYGILTLHLDKQHEDTKWMHVFASVGTPEASSEDVEVPETLDPSELWKVREALEKFTSGEDASGLGLGRGAPSLAEGELDDEVDASVGRSVSVTWIADDGSSPPWASSGIDDAPFELLSTPLPGVVEPQPSLIVKTSLDGTVFSLTPASGPEQHPSWVHDSTFSALAFVLASKQDTRFTHHVSSRAVLAFENGLRYRGGNVYIYRAADKGAMWAKQAILKVGDGPAGSLLGVGGLKTPQGQVVLLCLTEGELIIIRDAL